MVVAVAIIRTEQFHPLLIATTQPRSQALGNWGEEEIKIPGTLVPNYERG